MCSIAHKTNRKEVGDFARITCVPFRVDSLARLSNQGLRLILVGTTRDAVGVQGFGLITQGVLHEKTFIAEALSATWTQSAM